MTAFTRLSCLVEMSIDSGVGQVDNAGYGVHGPLHAKCVVPAGCWRSSRPPSVSAKRAITRHSLDRCLRHMFPCRHIMVYTVTVGNCLSSFASFYQGLPSLSFVSVCARVWGSKQKFFLTHTRREFEKLT